MRYIRSKLHRRIFMWFGATIIFTGFAVFGTMSLLTGMWGNKWKTEMERLETYTSGRFARVWDDPDALHELAESTARDLSIGVRVEDKKTGVIAVYGPACGHREFNVPIARNGVELGTAFFCSEGRRHGPLYLFTALALACFILWAASGKIARRLARPLADVAFVAQEIGRGKLQARAQLSCRTPDEIGALADAINDMAARIEKQISDQRVLLAAVSHELRTPLGHLRILSEIAKSDGASDKTMDDIEKEIVEIDTLVGELLASSRLDFSILAKRELDAIDIAKRALDRAGVAESKLEVVENGRHAEEVSADPTLLGRALANLIDNAKKHGGGLIALRVAFGEREVRFEIDDAGHGISAGEEKTMFEPFYKARNGDSGSGNGTLGLGLSLVKRIAEAHGGSAFAGPRPEGGARVGFAIQRS